MPQQLYSFSFNCNRVNLSGDRVAVLVLHPDGDHGDHLQPHCPPPQQAEGPCRQAIRFSNNQHLFDSHAFFMNIIVHCPGWQCGRAGQAPRGHLRPGGGHGRYIYSYNIYNLQHIYNLSIYLHTGGCHGLPGGGPGGAWHGAAHRHHHPAPEVRLSNCFQTFLSK